MDDKTMKKVVKAMENFMSKNLNINPEDENIEWDNDIEYKNSYSWTFKDKGTEYKLEYAFETKKVQLESINEDIVYPEIGFYLYKVNGDNGETKKGIDTLNKALNELRIEQNSYEYIAIGIADENNFRMKDFLIWDQEKGTQIKSTPQLIIENWKEEDLELEEDLEM